MAMSEGEPLLIVFFLLKMEWIARAGLADVAMVV